MKQIKFIIKEIPDNNVPNERIDYKWRPLKARELSELEAIDGIFDEPQRELYRLQYFAIGKEYKEAFYITPGDKKAFESIVLQFIIRANIQVLQEVTREIIHVKSHQEAENIAHEILQREKDKLKELESAE